VDPQVDMRCMIDDAFQQPDEAPLLEDRIQDVLREAFTVVDEVYVNCTSKNREAEDPMQNMGVEDPIGDTFLGTKQMIREQMIRASIPMHFRK
jgi:hypothetical protein